MRLWKTDNITPIGHQDSLGKIRKDQIKIKNLEVEEIGKISNVAFK